MRWTGLLRRLKLVHQDKKKIHLFYAKFSSSFNELSLKCKNYQELKVQKTTYM